MSCLVKRTNEQKYPTSILHSIKPLTNKSTQCKDLCRDMHNMQLSILLRKASDFRRHLT